MLPLVTNGKNGVAPLTLVTVTTGGDVSMMTPGSAVFSTIKSGGNEFKSLNNLSYEPDEFVGNNIDDDTARRGFMLVTVTAQACRAEWRYVSTVKSRSYTVATGPALRMLPGAANRRLIPG